MFSFTYTSCEKTKCKDCEEFDVYGNIIGKQKLCGDKLKEAEDSPLYVCE